jgi:imidazolonepropionase-like amidohydrolase
MLSSGLDHSNARSRLLRTGAARTSLAYPLANARSRLLVGAATRKSLTSTLSFALNRRRHEGAARTSLAYALSAASLTALALLDVAYASSPSSAPMRSNASPSRGSVAVRAGTIYLVEGDQVIEGGGLIVVEDGRIVSVGKDESAPAAARTIDYGPDAVIVPGLVSADSTYGAPRPSERTADPTLMATDGFDAYASYVFALEEGVTSAYLAPARGRLIAGQGAMVKLAGSDDTRRILNESAAIHGAISAEARNTPGYWKPPVPATVDVGMGVEQPQLPRSLMGAIVALKELTSLAHGGPDNGEYGPGVGATLRELVNARKPWRLGAQNEPEVRALLEFCKENGLPLVIDGAQGASGAAEDIAKLGAAVIVEPPIRPNSPGRDFGRERDSAWPQYDVAARLAKAGVKFAIAPPAGVPASELRFAAGIASRGGLDRKLALRAITLSPAEILGVDNRVGSLKPGKDADFVVFNGHPLDMTSNVIATYVDGELAFKAFETSAVVVSVEQLHLGDGEILQPGEVLMQDGKILEVGRRVGRPLGAAVVHGKAAMPGMIDALGHLGLEGSAKIPATRFELKRLVEPGNLTDKRVAQSGVTTVVMSPRGASRSGTPVLAYKPADDDVDKMVIADPVALRFEWTDRNRLQSGKALREVLAKAAEYHKKWQDYEKKLANWTPPKETESPKAEEKKEGEGEKGKDADKKSDSEKSDAEKKKDEKSDKTKKKKGEEEPAKPLTGAWETKITFPPFDAARMRLYLLDESGKITGSLRCDVLSDDLVQIHGKRDEKKVSLGGDGSKGAIEITAEAGDGKLKGKLSMGGTSADFEAKQTSTEYEIASRPELRKSKEESKKKEVKGEPKAPNLDPDLEPLRRAFDGKGAVIVGVEREDEIVECVAAFDGVGIKPILLGATDAWKVIDKIRGKVAGVLLSQRVTWTEPKTGVQKRNRYAELAEAGIPVAFHSDAEEGAADLPLMAAYAVSEGMSAEGALRALTYDAARMYAIDARVGGIAPGMDADLVLLDGSPLDASTSVTRVWVDGKEVR